MKNDEGSIPLRLMTLILILILSMIIAFIPTETVSQETVLAEEQTVMKAQEVSTEVEIVEDPTTEEILKFISYCESRHNQFDEDGNPLRNAEGSSAIGQYQIMQSIWSERAEELGYNLLTAEGNKKMAKQILLVDQGVGAWSASNDCFAEEFGFIISNNKIVWK